MSYRATAAANWAKTTTLHCRVTDPPPKPAMKTALTVEEEDFLVSFLTKFAHRAVPLTQKHLKGAIAICVNRMDPTRRFLLSFHFGIPGGAFPRGFRNRHEATTSCSKPLRQEANRFATVKSEVFTKHFATLQKPLVEKNLDDSRIFNLNESGVTPERYMHGVMSSTRVMTRSGSKDLRMPEFKN